MWLQVAPHSASSGFAGVRSSSCPEVRIHSALPAVFKSRVPPQLYFARRASRCITVFPVFAPSGPAGDRSSSCPDSRILQRICCVSREFPRCLALPAAPADTGSRLPRSCIFRLYRQRIFELPRISRSSAPPVLELSVSLELRSAWLRLPMSLQVSLRASSSGLALGLSPRVSPASLSLGVG